MASAGGLREISARPVYILPDDAFTDDVLVEGLCRADAFDCMVGYFDSTALADLAPGLAAYLHRATAPVRLVISPTVSEADFIALRDGVTEPKALLERRLIEVIGSVSIGEDALATHTLRCLAFLLGEQRLTIRVALVPGGLFHPKVWLFRSGGDVLIAHGSSNLTGAGITRNVEQVSVDRSWGTSREAEVSAEFVDFFAATWSGRQTDRYPDMTVIDLPDAVRGEILKKRPVEPPTEGDFAAARGPRRRRTASAQLPSLRRGFSVPEGIELDTGPFAHQGEAIAAWESAGRRGILAMATGSGKTITALAAASRLANSEPKGLLVVIAAPQLPLLTMWNEEVRNFGVNPVSLAYGSASSKLEKLEGALRRIELGVAKVELLVISHDGLVDPRFQAVLARARAPRLLIGDEVHRLGRREFLDRRPEFFEYRLGLSATPERQYDPDGTAALEEFFGPQVFEFGLDKAIGVCLVPFDYFVHIAHLESDELAEWRALTARITKCLRFSDKDDSSTSDVLERLRIRRRRILEVARRKVPLLEAELFGRGRSLSATLVYATDKDPRQLEQVDEVLRTRNVVYHKLTATETGQGRLAEQVIHLFSEGLLQVLTAKRVLDEGLNVPGIRTAYVLASTTVERQWVQRLGRVLRLDPTSGKTSAEYHDFIALPEPADGQDEDARRLVKGELARIRFFGQYARNAVDTGAWLSTVDIITDLYFS